MYVTSRDLSLAAGEQLKPISIFVDISAKFTAVQHAMMLRGSREHS